eukprot:Pgem_evm1s5259
MKMNFESSEYVIKNQSMYGSASSSITLKTHCVEANNKTKLSYAVYHISDGQYVELLPMEGNERCCVQDRPEKKLKC